MVFGVSPSGMDTLPVRHGPDVSLGGIVVLVGGVVQGVAGGAGGHVDVGDDWAVAGGGAVVVVDDAASGLALEHAATTNSNATPATHARRPTGTA
jgi:hypothetical protein